MVDNDTWLNVILDAVASNDSLLLPIMRAAVSKGAQKEIVERVLTRKNERLLFNLIGTKLLSEAQTLELLNNPPKFITKLSDLYSYIAFNENNSKSVVSALVGAIVQLPIDLATDPIGQVLQYQKNLDGEHLTRVQSFMSQAGLLTSRSWLRRLLEHPKLPSRIIDLYLDTENATVVMQAHTHFSLEQLQRIVANDASYTSPATLFSILKENSAPDDMVLKAIAILEKRYSSVGDQVSDIPYYVTNLTYNPVPKVAALYLINKYKGYISFYVVASNLLRRNKSMLVQSTIYLAADPTEKNLVGTLYNIEANITKTKVFQKYLKIKHINFTNLSSSEVLRSRLISSFAKDYLKANDPNYQKYFNQLVMFHL